MSQSHKFPKRTSSKQTSGLFEPGPWMTTHWLQEPHQETTNWKFCYAFIGNFCCFLACWQDFIVVAKPWTSYWSFWRIDGRGNGLSLWPVLNNKLQRKCICVREQERKKRKMKGKALFLIAGAFKIGANHHVKHDLNKWMGILWLPDTGKSDRNTLQSMKWHDCPKKGRKRSGEIKSPVLFSEVACYHLNSMITNLLHVLARICQIVWLRIHVGFSLLFSIKSDGAWLWFQVLWLFL